MVKSLELKIPDELYATMDEAEVRSLAQEALLVRLYELGKLGSGQAADLLGVSRRRFLVEVLGRYGVTSFDDDVDVAAEAARA
jgi:predicted HTH domain antitoxin